MISQEIVTAVSGTYVYTEQGRRRCAGNELFAVGDAVTVIGSLVVGWRRRASASLPAVDDQYYRFADAGALKMYYLDTGFSAIVQTDGIAQPVDETTQETIDATLVLHCYNADAEYLVWFAEPESGDYYRCIIQKDGETIADFMSVFTDIPSSGFTDAYIDGSGHLVWVAAYLDSGSYIATMAKYANGNLVESKTYDAAAAEAALIKEIDDRYDPAAAAVTGTVSNIQRTQTTTAMIARADIAIGKYVEETDLGMKVTKSGTFASASGNNGIFDLWALDWIVPVSGNGTWIAKYTIHHDQWNNDGSLFASYDSSPASAWLEVGAAGNYSFSRAAFDSLLLAPDNPTIVDENTEILYLSNYTVEKTSSENLSSSVSNAISATSFKFDWTGASRAFWNGPTGCVLTFTSGPNAGQSKTISSHSVNLGVFTVNFGSAWGTAPAAGDTFTLAVAYIDFYSDESLADITLTASCPAADQGDASTATTDFGNGFSAVVAMAKVSGDAIYGSFGYPTQDIQYDGASAYPTSARPQSYFPFGAWGPGCGLLINFDNKVLVGSGSGASVSEFNLFNGTVTKRFVGKSEEV